MIDSYGRAALQAGGPLVPFPFQRRDPQPADVVIDILHCGICHSDIHFVDNDWGMSFYPLVPGHEIVGRVVAVGPDVEKFAVGDLAAIGNLVDSCRICDACQAGRENACAQRPTPTYGGYERDTQHPTFGGYSNNYVVDERFALRLSPDVDLAATAPLLCAGITTYSPLRHWEIGSGHTLGVVGLGGLGHMAVKFGRALGARVVMFTTSAGKADDALRLGADEVVVSTDANAMQAHLGSVDFILDTVAAAHDIDPLLGTLTRDGTLCLLGLPEQPLSFRSMLLAAGRKRLAGSAIGGLPETQEMLEFCQQHGITADVESIEVQRLDEAFQRIQRNDVKYRFVLDMST